MNSLMALALTVALATNAAAQESATQDIRVLALRSLEAGRTVRVVGQRFGTRTGPFVAVGDSVLQLRYVGPVPLAAIDSAWVGHRHTTEGTLVGLLLGALWASAYMSHQSCSILNSDCINHTAGVGSAILLGSTFVGAVIGSGINSWERRYPLGSVAATNP